MDQRLSLIAAGAILGITPNAIRARIKKNPALYRAERDNDGKIWVWLDVENVRKLQVTNDNRLSEAVHYVEPTTDARIATLEAALAATTSERDHLRGVVEKLLAKFEPAKIEPAKFEPANGERARLWWWPF